MTTVATVLAWTVLVVAVAPVVRVPADPEFRRVFPRVAVGLGVLVAGWVLVVSAAAVVLDTRLVWPAAVVGGGVLIATVRASSWWLRRRGLPPGSRSITATVRGLAHRDHLARQAERHGPVFVQSQVTATVVCVVGLDRGLSLVRDRRDHLGPSPLSWSSQLLGGFLRYMPDDVHDVYGPLFRRAVNRRVVEATLPVCRAMVEDEFAAVVRSGSVPVADAARRIVTATLQRALFGIEPGGRDAEEFATLYDAVRERSLVRPLDRSGVDGLAALRTWSIARLDGDLAPCVLGELRAEDAAMPDGTCVDNLVFMYKIASGNLSGLVAWCAVMLRDHPSWRPLLGDPRVARAFTDETLRLAQSEYLYRTITRDIDLDGMRLPAGWLLRICVAESHRDPAMFATPEEFTDRFLTGRPPQSEYSPFGSDRHACNAVNLVTMTTEAVLAALNAHPEIGIGPSSSPVRDLRHWSHWRPGADLAFRREDGVS